MFQSTHLQAEMHGGVLLARITCEKIADYEATVLKSEMLPLAQNLGKVAVDFGEVRQIHPIGLGLLDAMYRTCRAAGGRFVMFNVGRELQSLLRMTPFASELTIRKTEDDALRAAQ